MKSIIFSLLLLITLNCCSPARTETTATDSTNIVKDTVSAVVTTTTVAAPVDPPPQEYPIDPSVDPGFKYDFPDYSKKLFTKDEREASATKAVTALLDQYSKEKFITIARRWTPSEYETIGSVTTSTWYFNMEGELRAYFQLTQSNIRAISNIIKYKTIYLFQDSLLIAGYSDNDDRGPEPSVSWGRYLTSQCPQCGIRMHGEDVNTKDYEIIDVYQPEIGRSSEDFFKNYEELLAIIREAEAPEKKDEQYFIRKHNDYFDNTYTIEYSVHPTLYEKFKSQ